MTLSPRALRGSAQYFTKPTVGFALVEEVGAPIGGLNLVADSVGERHFQPHGSGSWSGRPPDHAECAAETVRHDLAVILLGVGIGRQPSTFSARRSCGVQPGAGPCRKAACSPADEHVRVMLLAR